MNKTNTRLSVRITVFFLVIFLTGFLIEIGSRTVYHFQDEISGLPLISKTFGNPIRLDPYEILSNDLGAHWRLRPGYAKALQKSNNAILQINRQGFKGPELKEKVKGRLRILAVGDSTTFGLPLRDYPRELERFLKQQGFNVEVINGGVEGYSTRNVLYELERYVRLKPDIVILYIGWNDLYSPYRWLNKTENAFRFPWLLRNVNRSLQRWKSGEEQYARSNKNRKKRPDASSEEVKRLKNYSPQFLGNYRKIIDAFEDVKSKFYLVTLPGLYRTGLPPTLKALKLGHLPVFTDNPYVLAMMTERLNQKLRELSVQQNIGLIDLEKWSETELLPREHYFSDSVHLNVKGLEKIGRYLAEKLRPEIPIK